MKTGEHLDKPNINDRADIAMEHLEMSIAWKGEALAINEMKRHYSNYFKGIPDFKEYRVKLVTSYDLNEIKDTLALVKEKFGQY